MSISNAPTRAFDSGSGAVGGYHLSPLQQGMLFEWLRDRSSGTNVEKIIGNLDEPIDPERLANAWQQLVDRVDALRVVFRWEGLDEPVQSVQPAATLPF